LFFHGDTADHLSRWRYCLDIPPTGIIC
jgi:hypothetical protein